MKSCHLQNMDGPWGHYAKWNKSDREDKCYEHSYMWTLEKKKKKKHHQQKSKFIET